MMTDYFRGCRKAYASIIKSFASNSGVAMLVVGSPIYYILGLGIYQATHLGIGGYTNAVWGFMSALIVAWIIAGIAMLKVMPNLLTVGIFVYKAFGYWCLVSSILTVIFATSLIPNYMLSYILWVLMPSIGLLLVCGDIMRSVRSRLYEMIEGLATQQQQPVSQPVSQSDTAIPIQSPILTSYG